MRNQIVIVDIVSSGQKQRQLAGSISIRKGIAKDIIIVLIGVILIWVGLQLAFGVPNPFYVVASGSMIPELEIYDILVVSGNVPFGDLRVGDIIVFDRPADHSKVIVHRIVSVIDDDPRTLRTKGDANRASIPGTDFPITEKEYIGKVEFVIPQLGYVTQALKPPVNYIIIVTVIVIMVAKHYIRKKRDDDGGGGGGGTTWAAGGGADGNDGGGGRYGGSSGGDGDDGGGGDVRAASLGGAKMPAGMQKDLAKTPGDPEYMIDGGGGGGGGGDAQDKPDDTGQKG